MKAIVELELFGEDTRQMFKLWVGILDDRVPGLGNALLGNVPASSWAAEITGFDQKYKYARTFLKPKKDYSRANSKGSRGIFAEYVLESGRIYEIKSQATWNRVCRYFCTVDENGDVVNLNEEEVIECLKSRLE